MKKNQVRVTMAYDKDFIDRVKALAAERQVCYQSFLRILAAERLLQIEGSLISPDAEKGNKKNNNLAV